MSGFLIVPDTLYEAIHKRLDEEFTKFPDAEADRDALYHQLLEYFTEFGYIPEFTLEKTL
jgi:NADH:ubiquinone oxidoreductase subunit E